MPGAVYKIAIGEVTQRVNKNKGKGSRDVTDALKPENILKIKGNEKQGKK